MHSSAYITFFFCAPGAAIDWIPGNVLLLKKREKEMMFRRITEAVFVKYDFSETVLIRLLIFINLLIFSMLN